MAVLERIRRRLEAMAFPVAGQAPFHVTASFGVVAMTPENSSVNALFECADQALYQAKNQGRNRTVTYAPDQSKTAGQAEAPPRD